MTEAWNALQGSDAWWTIAAGALCAACCAVLGCYLVLQRLSLLGDALSHAVLPGIVVALLLAGRHPVPLFLGAMATGVLTAFLVKALHRMGRVPTDSSMGVVFTSLFALGVVLITRYAGSIDIDPDCVLYGLIEFVPIDTIELGGRQWPRAVLVLGGALVATLLFVGLLWKELKICAFDPALALTLGVPVAAMHYLLVAMVAAVTVASFDVVGSILVIAMLIVPAATAHLLTDRLAPMMLIAVAVGVVSTVLGYAFAVAWDTSVAGMMAVWTGVLFFTALLIAPRHGMVSRWLHNLGVGVRIVREDMLGDLWRHQVESRAAPVRPATWMAWWAAGQLRRRGLTRTVAGGLVLTKRGRNNARRLVRSHRLWETYAVTRLAAPEGEAHVKAHRLEHYLGKDLDRRMDDVLQSPAVDPQGKEIPRRSQGAPS